MLSFLRKLFRCPPVPLCERIAGVQTLAGLRELLAHAGREACRRSAVCGAVSKEESVDTEYGRVLLAVADKLDDLQAPRMPYPGEPRLLLFNPDNL